MEKTVNADGAFELMFELLKAHPWLVKPASTAAENPQAEAEALTFLASANVADGWGDCSPEAQGVAAWFIFELMAYLRQMSEARAKLVWKVPAHLPAWQQALHLVGQQIAMRSRPPGSRH